MSENRLMFWQRMARHYTTVMGRSAPLYREVCSRTGPSCAVCIGELEIHHEYRRGRKVRLNHGEYAISYCMAGAFE